MPNTSIYRLSRERLFGHSSACTTATVPPQRKAHTFIHVLLFWRAGRFKPPLSLVWPMDCLPMCSNALSTPTRILHIFHQGLLWWSAMARAGATLLLSCREV